MIGEVIGNYRILEKLGEGGMGEVFKGLDLMLDREVAIKVMRRELAQRPDIVERFRAEAVALAKLNHPNIATLYSFFREGDGLFMVMEFAQGETLDRIIDRHPRGIPPARAVGWFSQALEAIEHAHQHGVIHRDIKPANMMVSASGRLKVMDFGIARLLGTGRLTRTGFLVGTLEYMSPEQIRGMECDGRSDIYSLGIVLYKMLAGRSPFGGRSEYELLRAQVEEIPSPLTQAVTGAPEYLDRILAQALAKRPEDRFQTAREFQDALLAQSSRSSAAPIAPTRFDGDATRLPPFPRAPDRRDLSGTAVVEPPRGPGSTEPAALPEPRVPAGPGVTFRSVWRDYPAAVIVLGGILGTALAATLHWFLAGEPATPPPEEPIRAASPPSPVPPAPAVTATPPTPETPAVPREAPPAPKATPVPVMPPSRETLPIKEPIKEEIPEAPRVPAQVPAGSPPSAATRPAKRPERKAPAEAIAKPRTPAKTRKPAAVSGAPPAPDSRQEYFDSVSKDIEKFIQTPRKARKPARTQEKNGDYFKDLSKDVNKFLRR